MDPIQTLSKSVLSLSAGQWQPFGQEFGQAYLGIWAEKAIWQHANLAIWVSEQSGPHESQVCPGTGAAVGTNEVISWQ